jgi:hypothetical protein
MARGYVFYALLLLRRLLLIAPQLFLCPSDLAYLRLFFHSQFRVLHSHFRFVHGFNHSSRYPSRHTARGTKHYAQLKSNKKISQGFFRAFLGAGRDLH